MLLIFFLLLYMSLYSIIYLGHNFLYILLTIELIFYSESYDEFYKCVVNLEMWSTWLLSCDVRDLFCQ